MEAKSGPDNLAERLVIESGGEEVGAATTGNDQPTITIGEFFELLRNAPRPDPDLADDLEELQTSQPPMQDPPEWPD
jgi:hypothetical protein